MRKQSTGRLLGVQAVWTSYRLSSLGFYSAYVKIAKSHSGDYRSGRLQRIHPRLLPPLPEQVWKIQSK